MITRFRYSKGRYVEMTSRKRKKPDAYALNRAANQRARRDFKSRAHKLAMGTLALLHAVDKFDTDGLTAKATMNPTYRIPSNIRDFLLVAQTNLSRFENRV